MSIFPGLVLDFILAVGGQYLSRLFGVTWPGLAKIPVSDIMMAILLGMLMRNTIILPDGLKPDIEFGLKRLLHGVTTLSIGVQ